MQPNSIIVTVVGVGIIIFIYWFFLMKKEKAVTAGDVVDIVVDGGYSPSVISIAQGKITTLQFTRKDPSSCLEEVLIPEFKIRKFLPLNQTVSIELKPEKAGEYEFVCGMNMFHGKLIVK
ncbi:MAG TPA: cupredoxin domain-containing protein [Candidatus Udaeobacter sp.]|nr:cupredoxin domain-containing protein [Candidatus Udaeobacter sp.]